MTTDRDYKLEGSRVFAVSKAYQRVVYRIMWVLGLPYYAIVKCCGWSGRLAERVRAATSPYPVVFHSLRLLWKPIAWLLIALRFVADIGSKGLIGALAPLKGMVVKDLIKMRQEVESRAPALKASPPIAVSVISTQTSNLSFCGLGGFIISNALRLQGHRVINLTCDQVLDRCIAVNTGFLDQRPPCRDCRKLTDAMFGGQCKWQVDASPAGEGGDDLPDNLAELENTEYKSYPVGRIVLPSLRWSLRRFHLRETESVVGLNRRLIVSAERMIDRFEDLISVDKPAVLVVFNGSFFPEATLRAVAEANDIRVVTYETGHLPRSLYFSHGVATDVIAEMPAAYEMSASDERTFDDYFGQRLAGEASMGSVRFWSGITGIDEDLSSKMKRFSNVVCVFTNVAFDTSNLHANGVFDSMFLWLESLCSYAAAHKDTFFVFRGHPAERRKGKESEEQIEDWMKKMGFLDLPNVHFISPLDQTSSYDLAKVSKVVLVYNSTIGLESLILGVPILVAGVTKYREGGLYQEFTVAEDYFSALTKILGPGNTIVSEDIRREARRLMHYLYFKRSLDISQFIEPVFGAKWVLNDVTLSELHPDNTKELGIICDGIIDGSPFAYEN